MANQAALPPLVGREDMIFSDRLNHASIIDGARFRRGQDRGLRARRPCWIWRPRSRSFCRLIAAVSSSQMVSSRWMAISLPDRIYEVAEAYGLMTMVSDAHGEGVFRTGGRGIVDHFGLHGKFDLEVGTFSKAFGVVGGVVAGKKVIVDYLRQKARPFLFSNAVTAADSAACLAAVNVLASSTDLVDRLWENTRTFKAEMGALGFDLGNSVTPITPVMLGDVKLAKEFSRRLFEDGVFAMALGFPTVPVGMARIRVMISAALSSEDLAFGLEAFAKVGRDLGVIA